MHDFGLVESDTPCPYACRMHRWGSRSIMGWGSRALRAPRYARFRPRRERHRSCLCLSDAYAGAGARPIGLRVRQASPCDPTSNTMSAAARALCPLAMHVGCIGEVGRPNRRRPPTTDRRRTAAERPPGIGRPCLAIYASDMNTGPKGDAAAGNRAPRLAIYASDMNTGPKGNSCAEIVHNLGLRWRPGSHRYTRPRVRHADR